jgi:putative RecB family exonuclease
MLEELLAHYRTEWQERRSENLRIGRDDGEATFDDLARRILLGFQSSAVAIPNGRILAIEEELRGAVVPGLPDLLGVVDLVVETPEELIVRDWKTSRSRWSAEQVEEASEQLLLYGELARDLVPGKPVRIEFVVFTKTKEVAIEQHALLPTQARVDRTKRVMQRVWRAIQAKHFYPAPAPLACGGCPFREPCRKWPG